MRIAIPIMVAIGFICNATFGQKTEVPDTLPVLSYGDKGFNLRAQNGKYLMHLEWRGQLRLAYPYDDDPVTFEGFDTDQFFLGIRRARMKVGGHAYAPWLKYYLEYELFASKLLDFRLMIEKVPWLKIKFGQWKAHYNRERVVSSGKQQTVERSILTRPFTIDRQQGVSIYGNLAGEGCANFNYWLSLFTGTGRGSSRNDDMYPMLMSRIQWNFMGKVLGFTGSDLKGEQRLVAILAFAGVTNRSPYTRFSTSGGGSLEGFEEQNPGQYRVNQLLQESAGKYRGFSWQQELHWKEINDMINSTSTRLAGNLFQAGYFFHHIWDFIPEPIEFFGRYSFYLPDLDRSEVVRNEFIVGANWFFKGHRNKLSCDVTYLDYDYVMTNEDEPGTTIQEGWRFRFQWDVSF